MTEHLAGGLMADASNFEQRLVLDMDQITRIVEALRVLGQKIVLTSGTFDLLHYGHSMYLEAARAYGDFLIVGVDSDAKVRARKGPTRPAVPEDERARMVAHQRGVGLVTIKPDRASRWRLIRAVRPDVLVTTEETYRPDEIGELEQDWCGKVITLGRLATVSTSARLRQLQLADRKDHTGVSRPAAEADVVWTMGSGHLAVPPPNRTTREDLP